MRNPERRGRGGALLLFLLLPTAVLHFDNRGLAGRRVAAD